MATTTPNFGWPVPTSSDLVKNGATAIEGLGDAIDASLLDLKGGTTNQVLAKNSNTDMDFKWVADASGIPATILDAKGDIIAATAADTASRLAVGANGTVLTADSAEATGLKWATPSSGMTNPLTTTGDTIYSSSGSTPARLGIGTTGQVLTVASGIPSWATPAAAGSGPTFKATRTGGNQSFSASTTTKIQYNTEIWDSNSCYDPTTNYRFTPTTAGYYEVTVSAYISQGSTSDVYLYIRKNGADNSLLYAGATAASSSVQINALVDMNGSSDYLEAFIYAEGSSPSIIGTGTYSYFNSIFIRGL